MSEEEEKLVLEADIPLHIRRCDNSSHTMTFVLTQSQCCQKHTEESTNELSESSSKTSNSSSSNTLQVPSDFSSTERLDMRRRSLNSLLQENRNGSRCSSGIYYHTYRRSSAPLIDTCQLWLGSCLGVAKAICQAKSSLIFRWLSGILFVIFIHCVQCIWEHRFQSLCYLIIKQCTNGGSNFQSFAERVVKHNKSIARNIVWERNAISLLDITNPTSIYNRIFFFHNNGKNCFLLSKSQDRSFADKKYFGIK